MDEMLKKHQCGRKFTKFHGKTSNVVEIYGFWVLVNIRIRPKMLVSEQRRIPI